MGLNTPMDWIVCYEMKDHKRLTRLFKLLKTQGIPIQYSVFLVHMSTRGMVQLDSRILKLINCIEDDVRVYSIPMCSNTVIMGKPLIPDGVLLGEGSHIP
jgi:CRISPR-associated protein Cas2